MADLYRTRAGQETRAATRGRRPQPPPLPGVPSRSGPAREIVFLFEVVRLVHLVEHVTGGVPGGVGEPAAALEVSSAPVAAGFVPERAPDRGEAAIRAFVVRRELEIEQHQQVVPAEDLSRVDLSCEGQHGCAPFFRPSTSMLGPPRSARLI